MFIEKMTVLNEEEKIRLAHNVLPPETLRIAVERYIGIDALSDFNGIVDSAPNRSLMESLWTASDGYHLTAYQFEGLNIVLVKLRCFENEITWCLSKNEKERGIYIRIDVEGSIFYSEKKLG